MSGLWLTECALKASLLFGVAFAVSVGARRSSAELRHCLWALSMVSAALFPALQFLLPSWGAAAVPVRLLALAAPVAMPLARNLPLGPSFMVAALPSGWSWSDGLVALWTIGVVLFGLRVLAGLFGLVRLFALGRPFRDDRVALLLRRQTRQLGITRRVRLLTAPVRDAMPCTCGAWRPTIFLPVNCILWTDQRLRLVLTHELAHIRRFDWITNLMAELCLALYWFHPLAWLALGKLKEEGERACDDAVLLGGEDATRYANEVLQLVRDARRSGLLSAAALAVARPTHLERRFTAMLDTNVNRRRLTRRATLFTSTATLLVLLPLAALHSSAQSAAGRFTGVVTDPRGAAVPAATIVLTNAQANTRDMTTTGADGAFQFNALPAGEYEMRVLKPGFGERKSTAVLNSTFDGVQNVRLEMGAISEQVRVTGGNVESSAPQRLSISGTVQAAALIKKVTPIYPASAKANRIQGAVLLESVIGADGVPASLQVMNGQIDADLAKAAVEAVNQWRYRPTLLNGQPISVLTNITVTFTLAP